MYQSFGEKYFFPNGRLLSLRGKTVSSGGRNPFVGDAGSGLLIGVGAARLKPDPESDARKGRPETIGDNELRYQPELADFLGAQAH